MWVDGLRVEVANRVQQCHPKSYLYFLPGQAFSLRCFMEEVPMTVCIRWQKKINLSIVGAFLIFFFFVAKGNPGSNQVVLSHLPGNSSQLGVLAVSAQLSHIAILWQHLRRTPHQADGRCQAKKSDSVDVKPQENHKKTFSRQTSGTVFYLRGEQLQRNFWKLWLIITISL